MAVEEGRHVALRQQVAATWGEEAAETLFELVAPSGQDLATRQDVDRLDARFDRLEDLLDHRFESLEHGLVGVFERRISDAVTTQTRTLVLSQLGALIVIAALAFGLR